MGKQRRQSNRGKANRGGGSGGRGTVLRGNQPNRGGDGSGSGERMLMAEDRTMVPESYYDPNTKGTGLTMSAREFSNLSDESRFAVSKSMMPDAPSGYTWAEDRTLVKNSFYR